MLHASMIPRGDVVSLSPGRLEFVKGVETLVEKDVAMRLLRCF